MRISDWSSDVCSSDLEEYVFSRSVSPEAAPDKPTIVTIDFAKGDPVGIDGDKLSPAALLTRLNKLGGDNGIARLDLVENRFVGMKSRCDYETPGGTLLSVEHTSEDSRVGKACGHTCTTRWLPDT